MNGRHIAENVLRRLYAESMGRCMNPACQQNLFSENGDIIEKAHIVPYCKTAENTFENLIILCPNCHTNFDKNRTFSCEEVLSWKRNRKEEVERVFSKKFLNFDELKNEVCPILEENKTIYEKYYLNENKTLWDKFEPKVLQNNRKLKLLFSANLELIQSYKDKSYSNLEYVNQFIAHVNEFEITRDSPEKIREVLFPAEINSIFSIAPISEHIIPSTESLELLIKKLIAEDKFKGITLGMEHPFISIEENGVTTSIFLDDAPRLRQMYHNYKCFKKTKVRLNNLNFALQYIRSRNLEFEFINDENLREIFIGKKKMIFVYEYCLTQVFLTQLSPQENSIVVNLHNWNGERCISNDAYSLANSMNIKLLTMNEFYMLINELKE